MKELPHLVSLLIEDKAMLSRFLDSVKDALFVVDTDCNVFYWNQEAERLTGYDASEVLGRHCLSGIRCESCIAECGLFSKGEMTDYPVTIHTKHGKKLSCRKTAFLLKDKKGKTLGGVEILRDETSLHEQIAECKTQRGEVEKRERLQAAILGCIREGVVTIDSDWKITSFSRKAEEITGLSASQALGRFCHEVIGSANCDGNCPALKCLEENLDEAHSLARMDFQRGKVDIMEIAAPLTNEEGRAIGSLLLLEDQTPFAGGLIEDKPSGFHGIIGVSETMQKVFRMIEQVAGNDVSVLLLGESGTGKEMAARTLHKLSNRNEGAFQAVNCAALPADLLESELFGHVKGAFTGAVKDRAGRIEAAEGGTLFLDEIGEMPLELQAKLLRFLQNREYLRVGENKPRYADVRIIAATNREMKEEVAKGRFREDLYYRIRVIPITLPPLRERGADIALLSARLLKRIGKERNREGMSLTSRAVRTLERYPWPGNVRELINALEYAVALSPSERIRPEDFPEEIAASKIKPLGEMETLSEKERIEQALKLYGGNKTQAAEALGINRVTLYRKLKKYGI